MKKYIYIVLGIIVLSLISIFFVNKKDDILWLFGVQPEVETILDVVAQNGIQYSLNNPNGWLRMDEYESLESTPLIYVYKDDNSKNTKATIYSYTALYKDGYSTVKEVIEKDEEELKKRGANIKNIGTIQTKNNLSDYSTNAHLKSIYFEDSKEVLRYINVAYIDAGKAAVIISIQTQDEKILADLFPVFEETVKSYMPHVRD